MTTTDAYLALHALRTEAVAFVDARRTRLGTVREDALQEVHAYVARALEGARELAQGATDARGEKAVAATLGYLSGVAAEVERRADAIACRDARERGE